MDKLDFLRTKKLTKAHFDKESTFLIEGFLVEEAITMIYANGGTGKSWLSLSLASYLLENLLCEHLIYLDMDNPKRVLKERGVDDMGEKFPNLLYLQRSTVEASPLELLKDIGDRAVGNYYRNCVFIVDSVRDFIEDMNDGNKIRRFMTVFKNIREAGGTVILLHHSNKNGLAYQGGVDLHNSLDNGFKLSKKATTSGKIHFMLEVSKERDSVKDCGFTVCTQTLGLELLDADIAGMGTEENEFVNEIQRILTQETEGFLQGDLLAKLGYEKDDKTRREWLTKFDGKFWQCKKEGRTKLYYALKTK